MSFELIDCKSIIPLISAYHDGDVSREERDAVERHLELCPVCSRALAEYRAIGGSLRALSVPVPPVGLRRDVWRAIEAQEQRGLFGASVPSARARSVGSLPPRQEARGSVISVLTRGGSAWAKALPAALLMAGLLVVMAFVLIMRNTPLPVAAAELEEKSELTDYGRPVHVLFNKLGVVGADAVKHTSVLYENATPPYTLTTQIEMRFIDLGNGKGKLEIKPKPAWVPGARYAVIVDAPNIGLGVGNAKLDTEVQRLQFGAAAHTPTPTNTPTETPYPTDTPIPPSNTPGPTAVAEVTRVPAVEPSATESRPEATATRPVKTPAAGASNTPAPPKASATRGTQGTATVGQPTATGTAFVPSATPTLRATQTAGTPSVVPSVGQPTVTPGVGRTATPVQTATPRGGSPTATPTQGTTVATPRPTMSPTSVITYGCDLVPVRGFGKLWLGSASLRARVGCPEAREVGIAEVVVQRFELGVMIWRGDTKTIYVFKGGPRDTIGTWRQFRDTWTESEPTPRPQATPPTGMFEPERGFGKVWRENADIKRDLGWAVERERLVSGAWQEFDRANALWTAERQIYFLYPDGLWDRFEDTFSD